MSPSIAHSWIKKFLKDKAKFVRLKTIIVIGSDLDFKTLDDSANKERFNAILGTSKPILGLGAGGDNFIYEYGFTEEQQGQQSHHDAENGRVCILIKSSNILGSPNKIPKGTINLYNSTKVNNFKVINDLDVIGIGPDFVDYSPIFQKDKFFWGFSGSPNDMTKVGKDLFINVVYFMAKKTPVQYV